MNISFFPLLSMILILIIAPSISSRYLWIFLVCSVFRCLVFLWRRWSVGECGKLAAYPVLRQTGGGRAVVSVADIAGCVLEYGSLDGLEQSAELKVHAVLRVNDVLPTDAGQLLVQVPIELACVVCTFRDLITICQMHDVEDSHRTKAMAQSALRSHVCVQQCPPVRMVLLRPEWQPQRVFHSIAFSCSKAGEQTDHVQFGTQIATTPLVVAENTEGCGPRRYAFAEPVIPAMVSGIADVRVGSSTGGTFPPKPLPLSAKMDIIRRWVEACSSYALAEGPCGVCGRNVRLSQRETVSLDDDWIGLLVGYGVDATRRTVENVGELDRVLCRDAVSFSRKSVEVCAECMKSYRQNRLPKLSLANGLWLGEVPDELRALNFMEKLLVARYRHNMCVVTVRGGARQMRANAVVLAQPVAKFWQALPPSPGELAEMVAVLCTGPSALTNEDLRRAPVFIRKDVVLRALEWLKRNHCDYTDLRIAHENLEMYHEDRPVVEWIHLPSDGKEPLDSNPVYENGEHAAGVSDDGGPCPFVVEGICAEDVVDMSYDDRMKLALDHLKRGGRVLSYGQSRSPESIYHNPRLYPGMFPWLFPYGLGGFENENMVRPIARKTHVRWMLSYVDRRFQVDEYFPFLVYNQEQIRTSSRGAFALVERRNFEDVVDKILSVREDALADLLQRSRDTGYTTPETPEEKRCFELLSLIDHVGGHVLGSNTRKKWQRSEIRSMIYRYGLPIFFITFAPSESASPICLYLCGEKVDLESYVPLLRHDKARLECTVRNPVACARFFDLMVRLFVEQVLRTDTSDEGLFGRTSAYYGTVEEQGRKTLHLHALLWITGCLPPDEIRRRIREKETTFVEELLAWLDSCVQGQCNSGSVEDVVNRLMAKGKPIPGTVAQSPAWADPRVCLPSKPVPGDDLDERARRLWFDQMCAVTDEIVALVNVHDKRHLYGCQRPPDLQCRGRFPRPLEPVSKVDFEMGAITLKKGEAWVNTFNTVLTYLLRCNTDVTSLLSGTSVRAVIAYVTDYITKRTLKTHTMFDVILGVYNARDQLIASCGSRADAARRLVTKIVNGFTSRVQLGGPAVCSELLGFPDHYTNKRFKVVYWRSYVRFVERALGEAEDCLSRHGQDIETSDLVVLGRTGGRIMGYSRLDDYVYRPKEFQDYTLYDFLRKTDVVRHQLPSRGGEDSPDDLAPEAMEDGGPDVSESEDDENETRGQQRVKGRRRYRFMPGHSKRDTHAVVLVSRGDGYVMNFAGGMLPRCDVGDRNMYCKSMLTLFAPSGWRDGRELKRNDESWEDAFARAEFADEHLQVMKNMNLLYECNDARDDYAAQRRASSSIGYLAPFLTEGEVIELDSGKGQFDPSIDNDDLGAMSKDLDVLVQEGSVTSGLRAQMEAMKRLLMDELDELPVDAPVRHDEYGFHQRATACGNVPVRDRREWKRLLGEEKKKAQSQLREPDSVGDAEDAPKQIERTAAYETDVVGALDEIAFRFHTDSEGTNMLATRDSLNEMCTRVCALYALNKEQSLAFHVIIDHLGGKQHEPLRMVLTGMGGTGKSRVIDAVTYFLERRGEAHRFLVMAPTGTAASLLGGSTYHSVLGLGRGGAEPTKPQLGRIRDRLARVDLLLLDEISMVSCSDFYQICERLCLAFDRPTEAFAGRHFVVAGDFTQLPPAGQGQFPLYSAAVGMHSSRQDIEKQKNSLGKGVWHQFVTVVILKQNMRQRGESAKNRRYRIALENMRYGACSDEDLRLVDSRLLHKIANRGVLRTAKYSFASIIVPLNAHRDAINALYCERFARANGLQLHTFYAVDRLSSSRVEDSMKSALTSLKGVHYNIRGGMTDAFRNLLWDIPPGQSDNLPGKLTICEGMPVMLKNNEATELGVTNGSEGFVYGWESRPLSNGRFALTTLFVKLKNPPKPINIPGLPPDVVPIVAASESIKCTLPNDVTMPIIREQVSAIPNFAITDFNSQGRTRQVNVVDLRQCRGPQSVYTCLSRSANIEDTLILYSWDHGKVQNGIRTDLLRELRELEILNHITAMRSEGVLPTTISGCTRAELLTTYQDYFGVHFVPDGVHRALHWGAKKVEDLRPPPKRAGWQLVTRKKRECEPIASRPGAKKSKVVSESLYSAVNVESERLRKSGVPEFVARRPNRRDRAGMPTRLPRTVTPFERDQASFQVPLRWDSVDWSCGYDCLLRLMLLLWKEYPRWWDEFTAQSEFGQLLTPQFMQIDEGTAFEDVRDHIRDLLSEENPDSFARRGRAFAAIDQLVDAFCRLNSEYGQQFRYCTSCGWIRNVANLKSVLWSTGYNVDMRRRTGIVTTSQLLASVVGEHGRLPCGYCGDRPTMRVATKFSKPPVLMALEIPAEDIRFPQVQVDYEFSMKLENTAYKWSLVSVVYLGSSHFTCRLVGRDGRLWNYDGVRNEGICVEETTRNTDLAVCLGAKACLIVYALENVIR